MPGICTDRILETADRLSAAQLLLWLGWKATPGAHPDTVTSLCSAEFTPCLLCCVNNAGRAVGLPSAALLQQHRAHTSPKPKCSQARSGSSRLPQPHAQHTGSAPLLSPSGIRLLRWECADLGSSHGVLLLLGAVCAGQEAHAPPGEALPATAGHSDMETQPSVTLPACLGIRARAKEPVPTRSPPSHGTLWQPGPALCQAGPSRCQTRPIHPGLQTKPWHSLGDITAQPPLTMPPCRGNSLHHT